MSVSNYVGSVAVCASLLQHHIQRERKTSSTAILIMKMSSHPCMTDTDQGLKNGEAKFLPNVAALVKRKP